MILLSDIAKRVASSRKAAGLTQAALAREAGVSTWTIDALENGRIGEIGFNKVSRILAALNLELRIREANMGRPTLDELLEEQREERESERNSTLAVQGKRLKADRHD